VSILLKEDFRDGVLGPKGHTGASLGSLLGGDWGLRALRLIVGGGRKAFVHYAFFKAIVKAISDR
jgi:hypothetical protein